jgi:single-strand DNA-binding protein
MSSITINRVVLIGHLTRDPEMRPLPSGASVCGLRIVCDSARRNADDGSQEKPNYFDVDVFGTQAENAKKYLRKGSAVGVDGRLEWREWETPDEQKREAVSITAKKLLYLNTPGDGPDGGPGVGGSQDEIDETAASELVGVGSGGDEEDLGF